jgi:hypothetical protein
MERINKMDNEKMKIMQFLKNKIDDVEVLSFFKDKNVQISLLYIKKLNEDIIDWIVKNSYDKDVITYAINHKNISKETINYIYNSYKKSHYGKYIIESLFSSNKITEEIISIIDLDNIFNSGLELLINNPSVPISFIKKAIQQGRFFNFSNIAKREDLDDHLFSYLVNDVKGNNHHVALSLNHKCPPDHLDTISKCNNNEIRKNVAANPNTSDKTLKRLWKSENLRDIIVNNNNCPEKFKNLHLVEKSLNE